MCATPVFWRRIFMCRCLGLSVGFPSCEIALRGIISLDVFRCIHISEESPGEADAESACSVDTEPHYQDADGDICTHHIQVKTKKRISNVCHFSTEDLSVFPFIVPLVHINMANRLKI